MLRHGIVIKINDNPFYTATEKQTGATKIS